jgi:hypothetical protein
MDDQGHLGDARDRIRAGIQVSVLSALRHWWGSVYPMLTNSAVVVDWPLERIDLMIALSNCMLVAATQLTEAENAAWLAQGHPLDLEASALLDEYLLTGNKRIERIAAVTQERTLRELALGGLAMVGRIERWYGSERADHIADSETAYLWADHTVYTMRRADSHRWRWQHIGSDTPCEIFCQPNIGRIFSRNDTMPPFASHVGCHCVGVVIVD